MASEETRRKFLRGIRVVTSNMGVEYMVNPFGQEGVVVGYGRGDEHIRILRDGKKQPITYHASFWQIPKKEASNAS